MTRYAVRFVGTQYLVIAVWDRQAERMAAEGAVYEDKRRAWAVARALNRKPEELRLEGQLEDQEEYRS